MADSSTSDKAAAQETMALPPGLEFLRTPFMSTIGSPSMGPSPTPTASSVPEQAAAAAVQREEGNTSAELLQHVRQSLKLELDVKVAERLESVWQKGQQDLQHVLAEGRTRNDDLIKKMSEFRQQEDALEAENAALRQVLTALLGQLAQWGSGGVFPNTSTDALPVTKSEGYPDSSTASGSTGSVSPHLSFEGWPGIGGLPSAAPASESGTSSTEGSLNTQKLPDVPTFPFPAAPQSSAPAFSLADALGLPETDPVLPPGLSGGLALSPAATVFAPSQTEVYPPYTFDYAAAAEAEIEEGADAFVFSITLRKAEGCSLGLATSAISPLTAGGLYIDGVLAGGAAEAWNRQCATSGAAEKVLLPGDAIVSINGFSGDYEEMRLACENQQLLRLMVVRNDGPRSAPPSHAAAVSAPQISPASTTTMRADASAFVPLAPKKLSPDSEVFVPLSPQKLSAEASEFVPFSPDAAEFVPMGISLDETCGFPAY